MAVNLIFKCRAHTASKRVREAWVGNIAGQVQALKSVATSTTTDAHMFGARYIKLMGSTVSQLYIYISRRPNSNPCPRVSITLFKMPAANEPGDRATCFYSYATGAHTPTSYNNNFHCARLGKEWDATLCWLLRCERQYLEISYESRYIAAASRNPYAATSFFGQWRVTPRCMRKWSTLN